MSDFTLEKLKEIAETDHVQCGDASWLANRLLEVLEAQPAAFLIEFEEAITEDHTRFCADVVLEKPEGHYGECSTELIRKPIL